MNYPETKKEDILNRNIADVISNFKKKKQYNTLSKVFKTGKSSSIIIEIKEKNSIKKYISVNIYKIDMGLGLIFTDITRQITLESKLKKSQELFTKFINSSPDRILIFDKDLNLKVLDEKGPIAFGIKREDALGKHISKLYPDIVKSGKMDEILAVLDSNDIYLEHDRVKHPKFGELFLLNKIFKVGDGIGIISSDITTLKKTENLLRKQKDELDCFASTVAHDIRGKLQVLLMYNEIAPTIYSEEIQLQINSISEFLEKLLLIAKTGDILGDLEAVKLEVMIKRIIGEYSNLAKEISFEIENMPIVEADAVKIRQVFENLILNIIKHSKAQKVKISSKAGNDETQIIISDDGIGFEISSIEKLVTNFSCKNYSSFGMAIIGKILSAHGFSIQITGRKSIGTKVIIHIPNSSIIN